MYSVQEFVEDHRGSFLPNFAEPHQKVEEDLCRRPLHPGDDAYADFVLLNNCNVFVVNN